MKTARLSRAALMCTWPSQGARGADFYSLYFLPQDAKCTAHRRQPAGLRILKTSPEGSDPTCSPRRSLGVPARPRYPPVDTKKLPPSGVAFCGICDKWLRPKGLGDTCSDGSPNEARGHSLGPSPASLHASARLRISVRLRGDAPPREHARWKDSCGEARIWVRNCSRGLAHREERYPAERSFFAPQEEQASGPGRDASRAEIGRDEVGAAPRGEGRPSKGSSSLHGAC
jgi:hypothetical protein